VSDASQRLERALEADVVRVIQRQFRSRARLIDVLVDRPECLVLNLTIGRRRMVAKAFGDGSAAAQFAALSRLGLRTQWCRVLTVPEPLFVDEATGVVLMSFLPGRPASIGPTAQDAERIGTALAELHALPVDPAARVVAMADHVSDLIRPSSEALLRELPGFAATIASTTDRLTRSAPAVFVTSVHRDFQLRQLLLDGSRVGVVDWDDAVAGDPAFDVGYFLTYLETHHLPPALAAAFLAGYQAAAPQLIDELFGERLSDYRLFNLLRRAARRHRLRDGNWQDELNTMFESLSAALPREVDR
jgi:Phosphotransferase enzyme family